MQPEGVEFPQLLAQYGVLGEGLTTQRNSLPYLVPFAAVRRLLWHLGRTSVVVAEETVADKVRANESG